MRREVDSRQGSAETAPQFHYTLVMAVARVKDEQRRSDGTADRTLSSCARGSFRYAVIRPYRTYRTYMRRGRSLFQ